jgi:hypothetical protein
MIDSTRYPRLSRIDSPADLRRFGEDELRAIADELRAYLIESVGRSGGHFGAGLGVIELTVASKLLIAESSCPAVMRSRPMVAHASAERGSRLIAVTADCSARCTASSAPIRP